MKKIGLVVLALALTAPLTGYAADENDVIAVGRDKHGNEISFVGKPVRVVNRIYTALVKYDYRIKPQVENAIPPIRGMKHVKPYVDNTVFEVEINCDGLKRIHIVDARLFNNIGKEIEVYGPSRMLDSRFIYDSEKIITNFVCK